MNFTRFSAGTTNIFPIANSKNGGQLATEFNLRSRESVATDSAIQYVIGPSYTHSLEDFAVRVQSDDDGTKVSSTALEIVEGRAVLNGHYLESLSNVKIDLAEANAELIAAGQAPLKGKLAIGLRAMYSAEKTLAASLRVEDSDGMIEGVQVVVLPIGEVRPGYFVTPSDSPNDQSLVTAHLKLAEFDYTNGEVTPGSLKQNESKIQCIGADRIGDFDDLLIDTYVTRKGLNPKKLYTFSGKSVEKGSNKDTWCDSTDSLFVFQKATDLKITTEPQLPQAEFSIEPDESVALTLPHKQVDAAMKNNAGDQLYYAPRVMRLPAADWATNAGGTVTSSYTRSVKHINERLNELYSLPAGKQRGYLPRLEESRSQELPTINQRTWMGGDYVLVREDSTVEAAEDGLATAPATFYPVLPPKVEAVEYVETTKDGSIPESLTGNEVHRVMQDYTAAYNGSDSDSAEVVEERLSVLRQFPENYMETLGIAGDTDAEYFGNEGSDYMCVEVARTPTVTEATYSTDRSGLPPLQDKLVDEAVLAGNISSGSTYGQNIEAMIRFVQDQGASLAAACSIVTYIYWVSGLEAGYGTYYDDSSERWVVGDRIGCMAWPKSVYGERFEQLWGADWWKDAGISNSFDANPVLKKQVAYFMQLLSSIYLDKNEESPKSLLDLLNDYPNSKEGAKFASYNILKYYTEKIPGPDSEEGYEGIRPIESDADRFELVSRTLFDTVSYEDLREALPTIQYLVRNQFKSEASAKGEDGDDDKLSKFVAGSDIPGNLAAACTVAAIAKLTSDFDPNYSRGSRHGLFGWYGEAWKALTGRFTLSMSNKDFPDDPPFTLDGKKLNYALFPQLDFLCSSPEGSEDYSIHGGSNVYDQLINLSVPDSMEKAIPDCDSLESLKECVVAFLTQYMNVKRSEVNEQKYAWVAELYFNKLRQMYQDATQMMYDKFADAGFNHAVSCGFAGAMVAESMMEPGYYTSPAQLVANAGLTSEQTKILDSYAGLESKAYSEWAEGYKSGAEMFETLQLPNLKAQLDQQKENLAACKSEISSLEKKIENESDADKKKKLQDELKQEIADRDGTEVKLSDGSTYKGMGWIKSVEESQALYDAKVADIASYKKKYTEYSQKATSTSSASALAAKKLEVLGILPKFHASDGSGLMQWVSADAEAIRSISEHWDDMGCGSEQKWVSSVALQCEWLIDNLLGSKAGSVDQKETRDKLYHYMLTLEDSLDGVHDSAQAIAEDYLGYRYKDGALVNSAGVADPDKVYLSMLMDAIEKEAEQLYRHIEAAPKNPSELDSLPGLALRTSLLTWRFYYKVTKTTGMKTYADPVVITGSIPLATEDQIGGFYNISDEQLDYGYVYRDGDGHLRLLDYDLLRTGVLAYQLGKDQNFGSGLSSEEVQAELDEYVNDRVAFPDPEKSVTEYPDMIEVVLDLSEETMSSEIDVENVDSRFGCGLWLHVRGKASGMTTVNVRNCERVRIDVQGGAPVINVYDSCLYYDASTIDYIRTCDRVYPADLNFNGFVEDNRKVYPSSFTGLKNVSFWYEKMDDLDPDLMVDGMTIYEAQTPLMPEEIDYWSEDVSNDNHYFTGLESITLASNGDMVGCGIYVRNDITANVELGKSVAVMSFDLPQGSNLEYPRSSLVKQVKIDGSFLSAYEVANPDGYICMRTEFTALTPSGYRSIKSNPEESDYSNSGMMSLLSDCFRIENVVGVNGTTPLDGWESNSYHVFRGRAI